MKKTYDFFDYLQLTWSFLFLVGFMVVAFSIEVNHVWFFRIIAYSHIIFGAIMLWENDKVWSEQ